jgi:cell division protein FtsQ
MTRKLTGKGSGKHMRRTASPKNRYKRRQSRTGTTVWTRWLKRLGLIGYVTGVSLLLVLVHDAATQSAYFNAVAIEVSGNQRLSDQQVLEQAHLESGQNILAVNLRETRARLLAHPWIAEAQVRRKIPDRIEIRIEEHRAAALVDVGRRYLIDNRGVVFKAASSKEAMSLPEISGLRYSDLRLASAGMGADTQRTTLLQAVMTVLKLGQHPHSAVSIREIRRIEVDPQLGLTVVAFDAPKPIKLGFDNYAAKFMKLKQVMVLLNQNKIKGIQDFKTVDLVDPERIVMRPIQDLSTGGD